MKIQIINGGEDRYSSKLSSSRFQVIIDDLEVFSFDLIRKRPSLFSLQKLILYKAA